MNIVVWKYVPGQNKPFEYKTPIFILYELRLNKKEWSAYNSRPFLSIIRWNYYFSYFFTITVAL